MTVLPGTIAPEDRPTIETIRVIDAPRSTVFAALSEEDQITQWWGPDGFTCRDNNFDFRVGGQWKFVMHHDEFGDWPNIITYTKIVEDELIAFNHGDFDEVLFSSRIELADEGDKTRLHMVMTFPSIEERDETIERVSALQGQKQTFDKLEEFLAKNK